MDAIRFKGLLALLLLTIGLAPAWAEDDNTEEALSPEQQKYIEWARGIWQSLNRQTGKVTIGNGIATLDVPDTYYFLNPEDANKVLVDVWQNPKTDNTLGLLVPAEYTPFDDNVWAIEIQYDEDGHVSDEDASDIDYNELLQQMKKDAEADSQRRVKAGLPSVSLVGWAEPPRYDSASKKLYWAKELAFSGTDEHILNYNVRILGRQGVLNMNFIAGMGQLGEIHQQIDPVLAMASFSDGHRYADFKPDLDKVAAYGLGGLIAGKVLAKTGILVGLLLALKKLWIVIALGIGAGFKKLFGRKTG